MNDIFLDMLGFLKKRQFPFLGFCIRFIAPPDSRVVQRKLDSVIDEFRNQCDSCDDRGGITWSLFATDTETAAVLRAFTKNQASGFQQILAGGILTTKTKKTDSYLIMNDFHELRSRLRLTCIQIEPSDGNLDHYIELESWVMTHLKT